MILFCEKLLCTHWTDVVYEYVLFSYQGANNFYNPTLLPIVYSSFNDFDHQLPSVAWTVIFYHQLGPPSSITSLNCYLPLPAWTVIFHRQLGLSSSITTLEIYLSSPAWTVIFHHQLGPSLLSPAWTVIVHRQLGPSFSIRSSASVSDVVRPESNQVARVCQSFERWHWNLHGYCPVYAQDSIDWPSFCQSIYTAWRMFR